MSFFHLYLIGRRENAGAACVAGVFSIPSITVARPDLTVARCFLRPHHSCPTFFLKTSQLPDLYTFPLPVLDNFVAV